MSFTLWVKSFLEKQKAQIVSSLNGRMSSKIRELGVSKQVARLIKGKKKKVCVHAHACVCVCARVWSHIHSGSRRYL